MSASVSDNFVQFVIVFHRLKISPRCTHFTHKSNKQPSKSFQLLIAFKTKRQILLEILFFLPLTILITPVVAAASH